MSHLSIIIPAMGRIEALEAGLVSILQNRPPRSELLVVLNSPYEDPYSLGDEIRFIHAPSGASWSESVAAGLAATEATMVHLLSPGAEVDEGWVRAAMQHFRNPRVAAVAPWVYDPQDRIQLVTAGLVCAEDGSVDHWRDVSAAVAIIAGPTRVAGFYRRQALLSVGGFDPRLGEMADADLALRLAAAGWISVAEAASVVFGAITRPEHGFQAGRERERLYLRNVASRGGWGTLPAHVARAVKEAGRNLPSAAGEIAGRLAAWSEWFSHASHRRRLRRLVSPPASPATTALPAHLPTPVEVPVSRELRTDPAHPPRGTSRHTSTHSASTRKLQ